ncbi:MAG: DUF1614 domain-containing protein [Acidimicrobiales bacterium]
MGSPQHHARRGGPRRAGRHQLRVPANWAQSRLALRSAARFDHRELVRHPRRAPGGPHRDADKRRRRVRASRRIPTVVHTGTTTVAVNVGGALIPSALAGYLVVHDRIWLRALIAVAVVSVLVWLVARPVWGVGIVAPTFIPPIVAALAAIVIGGHAIAALAYVGGTVGTLVGADLVNLGRIRDLGAPLASIGGAGTFDGIFLTGILAVLLAGL